MVVRIAGSTDDCSVGAFAVKPRACGAAVRLWGLTAQPTEQTRAPVPSMHTCDAQVSHSELCTIETQQEKTRIPPTGGAMSPQGRWMRRVRFESLCLP
jgi:hypothetical protein